jgi:hypothetical protein
MVSLFYYPSVPRHSAEKTLGDLLTHSPYLANGVPCHEQKINMFPSARRDGVKRNKRYKQCADFIQAKKMHRTFTMQCISLRAAAPARLADQAGVTLRSTA